MELFRRGLVGISLLSVLGVGAWAQQSEPAANPIRTQDYLRAFHANPKKVMHAPLARLDDKGRIANPDKSLLKSSGISRQDMLRMRDQAREQICLSSGRDCVKRPWQKSQLSEANKANSIRSFLYEPPFVTRLLDMENQGLMQTVLKDQPWSDSFWPQRMGLIARRWRDPGFPNSVEDFNLNYNYWQSVPPTNVSVDMMSASEKYDLLVGDANFTLTRSQWDIGAASQKNWGAVPAWAGLCHGWAPAAIMEPNPVRSVTARARNGTMINFNPSDLKALVSLAWGETPPPVNFVGVRCKVANPREDEVGRVIDENCFDVNPATWHLAVVNQMGVKKKGFIFDSTYDLQVWNYPLVGYGYQYFNPQTLSVSNHLAGSAVRVENFTIDKFKKYRSANAKYIVGVAMDVTYAEPVQPSTTPISTPLKKTVKYVYDVELDASGNIIGGEWYSNWHPDFIWNLPPNGKPLSDAEKRSGMTHTWDPRGPINDEIQKLSAAASPKGQVLAVVVQTLMGLAKETTDEAALAPAPAPAPAP